MAEVRTNPKVCLLQAPSRPPWAVDGIAIFPCSMIRET